MKWMKLVELVTGLPVVLGGTFRILELPFDLLDALAQFALPQLAVFQVVRQLLRYFRDHLECKKGFSACHWVLHVMRTDIILSCNQTMLFAPFYQKTIV
jgi:hypothetical protein